MRSLASRISWRRTKLAWAAVAAIDADEERALPMPLMLRVAGVAAVAGPAAGPNNLEMNFTKLIGWTLWLGFGGRLCR